MYKPADAPPHARTDPGWRPLGRWARVAVLACLPFAVGLLAGVLGPSHLSLTLTPVVACTVLVLGVPLWFLIADALASALALVIKRRRLFVAVDAACGLGLLFLLYSLLIQPWTGALVAALAAAACWWVVASPTHRAFRSARQGTPFERRGGN